MRLRLNAQHHLWKEQMGYVLHPSIPVDRSDLKIADVATGTGYSWKTVQCHQQGLIVSSSIWLLELSRQHPSTNQLDGFDIDLGQCPLKQWLPSNVTMNTLDIFAPVPKNLVGKYDIGGIAIVFSLVKNDNPTPLLSNLLMILSRS